MDRNGYTNELSDYYLPEDTYLKEQVVKVLEFMGGVKTKKGYFFDYDVKPVVAEIIRLGYLPEKRSHQFYPTPEDLAQRLVDMVVIESGDRVLEPSAGHGNIAMLLPKDQLTCVEINPINVSILKSKGLPAIEQDFIDYNPKKKFHKIFMNPPFSERQAEYHVEKAFTLLEDGGTLCAILPAGLKNKILVERQKHEWSEVIVNAFDDTSINVVILTITRDGYSKTRFDRY